MGSYILNFEQKGNTRAEYGKQTIKKLSEKLNAKYGKGWSVETLKKARKFYEVYSQAKKGLSKKFCHAELDSASTLDIV